MGSPPGQTTQGSGRPGGGGPSAPHTLRRDPIKTPPASATHRPSTPSTGGPHQRAVSGSDAPLYPGRDTPTCRRTAAAPNDTSRYADARSISVHTAVLAGIPAPGRQPMWALTCRVTWCTPPQDAVGGVGLRGVARAEQGSKAALSRVSNSGGLPAGDDVRGALGEDHGAAAIGSPPLAPWRSLGRIVSGDPGWVGEAQRRARRCPGGPCRWWCGRCRRAVHEN
jgi:hypothetical protein